MYSNLIIPLAILITYFVNVKARITRYKQTYTEYQSYGNYANNYYNNYNSYNYDNNENNQPLPTGDDCLTVHNRLRNRHYVDGLEYDATLEKYAIKRANMAKTDIFEHPKDLPYGENLYWRSGTPPTCKDATDTWYNEISLYSYRNPGFSSATGHFTQMIWKKTKLIGCASAQSKRSGKIYIACNYWPRGFYCSLQLGMYWADSKKMSLIQGTGIIETD